MKEKNNDNPVKGIEIGVKVGGHAKAILTSLNIEKLYLIDPWENQIEKGLVWKNQYNDFLTQAKENLKDIYDKVEYIKKRSEDASNDTPDNLDFVYIDGNHLYDYVTKDLQLYYPKVKQDGIVGGHDIHSINVFTAIIVYCLKNKINPELHIDDYDWYLDKSKNKKLNSLFILSVYKYCFDWVFNSLKTASKKGNIFWEKKKK